MEPKLIVPYLQIISCALIWGMAGPLIRWSHLSTIPVVTLRFMIPMFSAFLWLRYYKRQALKLPNRSLIVASLLHLITSFSYVGSFALTSIANVMLVLYTRPVIATFFGNLLLQEKVSARLWCLLVLSFSGALLILTEHSFSFHDRDFAGMLASLFTAIVSALMWIVLKKGAYKDHSPLEIVIYQHLPGALILLLMLPWQISSFTPEGTFFGSLYAVLIGLVGWLLYFHGQKALPISRAMPITYLELLVALLIGSLAFGENFSIRMAVGGLLIVVSAYFTVTHKH